MILPGPSPNTSSLTCVFFSQFGLNGTGDRDDSDILPRIGVDIFTLEQYRLRWASYIHEDEATRNLMRAAPKIITWDDHELSNNNWVNGSRNHEFDRDGPVDLRWQAGHQAFMEWNPVRIQPGSMGFVTEGTITQIIEWGKLATFIAFDTRITSRSEEPAVELEPSKSLLLLLSVGWGWVGLGWVGLSADRFRIKNEESYNGCFHFV